MVLATISEERSTFSIGLMLSATTVSMSDLAERCVTKLVLKRILNRIRCVASPACQWDSALRVGGAPHMNAGPDSDMSWILCGARPIKRRARSESGLIAPNIAGQSARTWGLINLELPFIYLAPSLCLQELPLSKNKLGTLAGAVS